MHPLNPFLRAFFRSALPTQCVPVQNYVCNQAIRRSWSHLDAGAEWSADVVDTSQILLVPTTEVLLTSRDRESNSRYIDLAGTEEFLSSHVLRLPASAAPEDGKTAGRVREGRGKAKQFNTLNGRTVLVKETSVYSNRGFRNLTQAQLLNDVLWYPGYPDGQPWLVYYISKPLIGIAETISIASATSSNQRVAEPSQTSLVGPPRLPSELTPLNKDLRTFNDILNAFPMIARQMQPDLERLFKEFSESFEKPLPSRPQRHGSDDEAHSPKSLVDMPSHKRVSSNGHIKYPPKSASREKEEANIRQGVEDIVIAAIDLFLLVDKQQLSMLGATTTLTGPLVERLIEQYVMEQVHDSIVFPAICAIKRFQDQELEARIRQMENLDISQVGIPISGGMEGKHELLLRLEKGVEEFRKLGVAGSPQEMMEILLSTEKTIAAVGTTSTEDDNHLRRQSSNTSTFKVEQSNPVLAINADTLVSLLLVVVIRSQVRHLQARLSYMRNFIFADDVEGGEMGYALSTFEAVLSYLEKDSAGLRRSSRRNKLLWEATKEGRIQDIKAILNPEEPVVSVGAIVSEPDVVEDADQALTDTRITDDGNMTTSTDDGEDNTVESHALPSTLASNSLLASQDLDGGVSVTPRKRVSMDMRSMSSSSGHSYHSRATTIDSRGSGPEGDTSIDRLSKTQDPSGESVVMMAVEHRQSEALRYLLGLSQYYPLETILADCNNAGTTLLSAAVQLGHFETIQALLDFILDTKDERIIAAYFARQDSQGRTAAHYLFNAHYLIKKLGRLLPWQVKDKNGQTPLFALCRSYDHPSYRDMVGDALVAAEEAQADGLSLHLDDHVDAKGNTLLHIINDAELIQRLLLDYSSDVNATNDKRFTPLMVASKYGRVDLVSIFLGDPRIDVYARDLRGLTAVELAKDDDVRDRIDDLMLFSIPPDAEGRRAAVVRSFFVEDATIRLVVKSAVPASKSSLTITTSRRSLADFENLATWLSIEHPVSWLPSVSGFRSPFQIPSRPSRAVLRDIQNRLDGFLRTLLAHPTFSNHETVWEFFLMPEIMPELTAERSRLKAATQAEKITEEYAPVNDVGEVEVFTQHAKNEVGGVDQATRNLVRRVNKMRIIESDISDAQRISSRALSTTLSFLDATHLKAFGRFTEACHQPSDCSSPYTLFQRDLQTTTSTITAMLEALSRPHAIIDSIQQANRAMDRHLASLRRSDRWPLLGLLDETRNKLQRDAAAKVDDTTRHLTTLRAQLRHTQQTVAAELAGWQDLHRHTTRRSLRLLAERMLVVEKTRMEGMRNALRGLTV